MSTLAFDAQHPRAVGVQISAEKSSVELDDGITISVPLTWYPRLTQASAEESDNWRLIGHGLGIHWDDLDEDVSVEGLLAGKRSGESRASYRRWLDARESSRHHP